MYDLLIFDLDGTLVDSAPDIAAALNWTLQEEGLPTHSQEAVMGMVGGGVAELVTRALGATSQELLDRLAKLFRQRYYAYPVVGSRTYPGVVDSLEKLKSRPMAIATNKPGALARTIIERLEIARYFFTVVGEDDVAERKPDPEGVTRICAQAGTLPCRALLVGDSAVDALTAQAAGMDACLVSYGYGNPATLRAAPARFRIDRFNQLFELPGILD